MSGKELTFSSEVGGGVLDSGLDYDTLSLDTHTHTLHCQGNHYRAFGNR